MFRFFYIRLVTDRILQEVTLADLAHLPYGSGVSEKLGMNIFATPNLARYA